MSRGLVRYIGASNMSAWQIMKANGLARQHNCARFETVQSYYTIAGRDLEREIIPMLMDQQLGLMVWSPLAGGLLSGKFARQTATPNDARRLVLDFPPVDREHALDVVDAIRPIAEAHGVSVARVALAWLLHQKAVMSVIIGAKSIDSSMTISRLPSSSFRPRNFPPSTRPALSPANIHNGCSIASTAIGCQLPRVILIHLYGPDMPSDPPKISEAMRLVSIAAGTPQYIATRSSTSCTCCFVHPLASAPLA